MVGSYVMSKAGHDRMQLYIVVGTEGDFAYLCDGKCRPVEKPKKKRLKHIQRTNTYVKPELLQKLIHHQPVRNEELKYAIREYDMK